MLVQVLFHAVKVSTGYYRLLQVTQNVILAPDFDSVYTFKASTGLYRLLQVTFKPIF